MENLLFLGVPILKHIRVVRDANVVDILDDYVMWADPDTHKPCRWKATSSSPKVIYVAYIPTMFAKHNEQVN